MSHDEDYNEIKIGKGKNKRRRDKKKDDGIAIVPAKMSSGEVKSFKMREEIRDAYNKRPHPSESKSQKEIPVDAANYTTQQLEQFAYSGYRLNRLKGTFEIWVLGKICASERAERVSTNPSLIADMHERAFSTNGSIVEVDVKRKIETQDDQASWKNEPNL